MKNAILALALFFCAVHGMAQNYSWEDFVQEYATDGDLVEEEDWRNYMEELKALHEQPLNLNTASADDLLFLPFLNEKQVEEIHAYIYLHGPMQSLSELLLLRQMDWITRQKLALFAYAGESPPKEQKGTWAGRLEHSLTARTDIPLYYRKGHQVKNGYRGDALYQRLQYQLKAQRHLSAGFRMEKDAGERYYDSYGAFFQIKEVGALQQAVIGDYRIGVGEGLVLGGNSWNSKSSPSMKTLSGIRPMTGMDESGFMRGVAAQVSLGRNTELNLFASHRKTDATLNPNGNVQTILTSGYHRTASEPMKKRNTASTLSGGNLQWRHNGIHLGATGYYQQFNRTLEPGNEPYRRIYPKGRHFGVMGIHYGYSAYRFSAAGETAYSTAGKAFATLHRAAWNINRRYTLSAVQRYYAPFYHSFHAAALGENSNVQNENGVLLHLKSQPFDGWQLQSYVDFFYHKWPRYRMTHSSAGQEGMVQISWLASEKHGITVHYRIKRKETADVMEPHHRLRMQWNFTPHSTWKLQSTALLHQAAGHTGTGIQQTVRYASINNRLRLTLMGAYFHAPNHLSRLYFYEPNLYQSISSSTYYGHGIHGVFLARWTTRNGRWMFEGKYSYCHYFDRKEIGSGLQTIFSPQKHDIAVLLKVKI